MKRKLKITVLMGGKSSEHDVSLVSGKEVIKNLDKQKYSVTPLLISREGIGFEKIFKLKPDVVFIAMHGKYGEDGTVQGLLELVGISYSELLDKMINYAFEK